MSDQSKSPRVKFSVNHNDSAIEGFGHLITQPDGHSFISIDEPTMAKHPLLPGFLPIEGDTPQISVRYFVV